MPEIWFGRRGVSGAFDGEQKTKDVSQRTTHKLDVFNEFTARSALVKL